MKSITVSKFIDAGYNVVVAPDGDKMRVRCPVCDKAWIVDDGYSAGVYARILQSLKVHMDGHAVKRAFREDDGQMVIPSVEVKSDAPKSNVAKR